MKLSPVQERTLAKLTMEWQSRFQLDESIVTLMALHKRGLIEIRAWKIIGEHDVYYDYRLKQVERVSDGN